MKVSNLQLQNYRKNHSYMTILHHITMCEVFEQLFNNSTNCQQVINLMNFMDMKNTNHYLQIIKSTYIQLFEKLLSNNQLTEKLQQYYSSYLLPFLIGKILKSTQNDIRFNCMKFLLYLVSFYMSQDYIYDSTVLSSTSNKIVVLINSHLLPQIDFLLEQGQTVASMTMKLIAVLFQISQVFIKRFNELGKIKFILPFYTEQSNINVLKIIQYLTKQNYVEISQLQTLLPRTVQILQFYISSGQDIFLQYPLQILKVFVTNNHISQEYIDIIWELVVPMQGHEDIIVRQNSENLIEVFLKNKKTSSKGKWDIKEKKGFQNYEKYIQITGKQLDPKIIAPFKGKVRYNQNN